MSDLVSRLLAAIEELERLAKACPGVEFSVAPDPSRRGRYDLEAYAAGSMTEFDSVSPIGGLPEVYARHIAHNDPAAVLRRCEADRTIIHEHSAETVASLEHGTFGQEFRVCRRCAAGPSRVVYPCPTVKHLAAGYGISVEEETTGE